MGSRQVGSAQSGAGALSSYTYTLGAAGNRLTVAELSGRTVNYAYDALYRLTTETIGGDPAGKNGSLGYTYDSVGNRATMTSTLNAIPAGLFNYDANDRLTTDQYDANGNTVSSTGIQNQYDFENHLIQHGDMAIVYDGDGNRVSKTVGGVTTQYLVDTVNPTGYAQVVDEIQNGAVTKSYSYGLERISQNWQPTTGNWQPAFYGYDGHGSVRFLTDAAGSVTDTYDYDAFGNLIASTGSTPNNYLFAGEQWDSDVGLYYNRARYLDVRMGRFWGMDTFEGDPQSPGSLHKYLYANGNPVNNADPNGRFSIPEVMAVAFAVVALSTIAYLHFNPIREKFGLMWSSNIDWSTGLCKAGDQGPGCTFTSEQISIIKFQALQSLKLAFLDFFVRVEEGVAGAHTAYVDNRTFTGPGGVEADGHTDAEGMSKVSYVHFGTTLDDVKDQMDISDLFAFPIMLGNAIGNTAAHEIGHQFGLPMMHNAADSFYEHDGATPAFFQQHALQWTSDSRSILIQKLGANQ